MLGAARASAMLAAALLAGGCGRMANGNAVNAMYAVEQRDQAALREAVSAHRGLEQRDAGGDTPLLLAIASGQYVSAEILEQGGADIWAFDEFGLTAMHGLLVNPPPAGTVEGDAQRRLVAKLRSRGFPFPPPPQAEVLAMAKDGRWPPRQGGR